MHGSVLVNSSNGYVGIDWRGKPFVGSEFDAFVFGTDADALEFARDHHLRGFVVEAV
jgi:hypothetical protein